MFAPAMLFSISGLMVGVSALATTADIVGDLAVYGTPWYVFWTIIQRGSWTVFKRLPLLFAVALPIGLAQKQPARCCLEALVAYFAYCFFLSEIIKLSGDNLGLEYPSSLTSASGITVIDGIKTLDTGIIGPLAVSATVVAIHDRFYDAKVPDWLGTFSGSSLVYLISFFAVFALAAISAAIVPYVYACNRYAASRACRRRSLWRGHLCLFRTSTRALWPAPPALHADLLRQPGH